MLFALQKFRQYVYGVKFTVVADHCPLTGLKFAKDASSGKLHRWAVRLSEFDFTVEYKKGKKHSDADGLSRLPRTDDMVEPPEFNINNLNNRLVNLIQRTRERLGYTTIYQPTTRQPE